MPKGNINNLRTPTAEEAREKGRLGGIASGEARRRRKTLKEELLLLLEEGDTQKSITLALLDKAMSGDTKAFEVIRDSIGEKQSEKVDMRADFNVSGSSERLTALFDEIKNDG